MEQETSTACVSLSQKAACESVLWRQVLCWPCSRTTSVGGVLDQTNTTENEEMRSALHAGTAAEAVGAQRRRGAIDSGGGAGTLLRSPHWVRGELLAVPTSLWLCRSREGLGD